MTPQELGLPPRFEGAMKRRLGRSGVFVEVNGKYYLSEVRLKQLEEMRVARGGAWNPRKRIMTLRLVQLGLIVLLITLYLVNFYMQNPELKILTFTILVVWLLVTILQIYFISRARNRFSSQQANRPKMDGQNQSHFTDRLGLKSIMQVLRSTGFPGTF